jgi:hypothetical protein
MITYSEENFEDLWPLMQKHLEAHWQEVGGFPEHKPDLDVEKSMDLQNQGALACFAARDGETLVGYVVDFIQFHLHYKTVKVAICDVHYIAPEYRAKCARGLTKFVEKVEREMGVFARITRSKRANRAGDFFKAMGYTEAEVAWLKRL